MNKGKSLAVEAALMLQGEYVWEVKVVTSDGNVNLGASQIRRHLFNFAALQADRWSDSTVSECGKTTNAFTDPLCTFALEPIAALCPNPPPACKLCLRIARIHAGLNKG